MWNEILKVDATLIATDTTQLKIKTKEQFQTVLSRHCRRSHYMFSVKKCEKLDCTVCDFPRLPPHLFQNLHHLPDPIPMGEHFKSFDDLYGTETTEEY